jgi:amidase
MPPPRHTRLADFRIAVLPRITWLPTDHGLLDALDRLAVFCEAAGARVSVVQPEIFADLRRHHQLFSSLLWTSAARIGSPDSRKDIVDRLHEADSEFAEAGLRGLEATAADYVGFFQDRERYRAAYRSFFREWDVLLTPVTLTPAFPHQPMAWPPIVTLFGRTVNVEGEQVAYDLQSVYIALATLSGQPATAFPFGLTSSSLPIGLQAIGPYLEDYTPIRFAALVAQELGGFTPPPAFS